MVATLDGGITVSKVYQKRTPPDVLLYLKDLHNKFHKLGSSTSFVDRYKQLPNIEAGFAKWADDNGFGASDSDDDSDSADEVHEPPAKRQRGGGDADNKPKNRDCPIPHVHIYLVCGLASRWHQ